MAFLQTGRHSYPVKGQNMEEMTAASSQTGRKESRARKRELREKEFEC